MIGFSAYSAGYSGYVYNSNISTRGIDAGEAGLHQADANKILADAQYEASRTCAKKYAQRLANAFNF